MTDLYWLAPLLSYLFVAVLLIVPVFFLGRWYEREAELWKETRRG